jgi:hypothetical protein
MHIYSSSATLLSQIILMVMSSIRPFKYHFPVKYNMPLEEYPLLESPLARVIGITVP